jgi:hypothetical protein
MMLAPFSAAQTWPAERAATQALSNWSKRHWSIEMETPEARDPAGITTPSPDLISTEFSMLTFVIGTKLSSTGCLASRQFLNKP